METSNKSKNVAVIGEKDGYLELLEFFDSEVEANTYIGIEQTQVESEGVSYSIYRRVK